MSTQIPIQLVELGEITRGLALLAPELAVALAALLIFAIDLLLPGGARRRPLMLVALAGLAAGFALAVLQLGAPATAFGGFLVADAYAAFFQMLFIFAAALVILASETFVDRLAEFETEFYGLVLLATVGFMLLASTAELITIYLSLEITSLSLAFLATWAKRDLKSSEAGLKFFVLSAISSAVLLYGLALLYGVSGGTTLARIAEVLAQPTPAALLAVTMLVAGFGFKIAAVPFQFWTPDVYEGAPTPVTAFLSVASKAAGFAILLRIFMLGLPGIQVEWTSLFAVLAALTMTVGNVLALVQSNIKRLLAYSSIAHVGYVLMGFAAATPAALSAVLFYLLAYAFMNLGAFVVVIAMGRYAPDDQIGSYAGLARRSPWLGLALAVSLLSLAGLPPLVGFFSKLYLFYAAVGADLYWLVLLAVLNSAVSLYYYVRPIHRMYLRDPESEQPVEVGFAPLVSLATAVVGVFLLGWLAGPLIDAATAAAIALAR